jgi:outer membrane protein OmpA-like peptidoglycan-associated protein/ABC-type amino acid transport substrate-binding protein
MNRNLIGALALVAIGVMAIIGFRLLKPLLSEREVKKVTDAGATKGTIKIAVDSWVGYYPLISKEMKRRLRAAGYNLMPVNDNADYPGRMKKIKNGEYDFAVATVDSDLLNSQPLNYPAVIGMVIDESFGGDAFLARSGIQSLDDLKKRQNYKIAFTPNSPSEHLLKGIAVHFDIPELKNKNGAWRVETKGSEDALKMLLAGTADAAVLWEPDVTKALMTPGITKLIGTEDTKKYIVDVLLLNKNIVSADPDLVNLVFYNYFLTLKHYRDNPEMLKKEVAEETKVSEKEVENMLKGVKWVNLQENAHDWFGIGAPGSRAVEGIIEAIESTAKILVEAGDFQSNPIPNHDPYRLINKSFIAELYNREFTGQFGKKSEIGKGAISSLDKRFAPLDEAGWKSLKEIGTLKINPVTFLFGSSQLDIHGKEMLDDSIKNLEHFPNYRMIIKGHTGLMGDPEVNKILSQERADSVKRYLEITHNIDPDRMKALGMGSAEPLPQQTGETDRAYGYRLPRVELYLVTEVY